DLVARLREREIAAGPVYNTVDLMKDEAFLGSGMLAALQHGEVGERIVPTLPVRFSAIEPRYRGAPMIGEHTGEVLSELLGMSADEIAQLREDKVLL
ncbi:MAG: CoA transferase, partial [Pseudomonadota bacterium]